ncbi:replicative DNA helicase [Treponema zuelzerae]|uniref:Replicative DNA helicase n=1 Tax=Teretinema zuelzerae TaxID=156 RepID=A0AAE3EIU8_9SPIR|nr:replicative DNA helicase [Teretinema zuelzerae]MBN2812363.1 replicative DNA helicase [Spirochaetales bacterium]MCD1654561.1 replicative DNA helicase [Teretinema zuelzerae]
MNMPSLKDKVPPNNLEAEQATLGALLLDAEAIGTVIRYLRPDNFYSLQNQKIFKSIISLFNKGQRSDLITITDELRQAGELEAAGGPAYIASLTDTVPTSANVEYYARIVLENSVRRALLTISHKIIAEAHDQSTESRAVLENAQKQIFELTDANQSATFKTPKDIIPRAIEAIEKLYHTRDAFTGVPSGLIELDQMTSGFQKSELIIIGARPSVGKTALALSMAAHTSIKEKIPTAFFSLEMSDMQLMQRLISSEAKIPSEKIRTGLLKLSDFQSIQDAAGLIYEAPLYIVDMPNMKLLDLRAMARRLRAQFNIEIIFVDYLTLITSENSLIPRHEQIAEISRSLKSLARELNIPVVALSQVKRDAEGKKPNLADLRESGSIEQDADVVMFLHRERVSSKDAGDKEQAIDTELIVAKQRNGPIGDVEILFLPRYTKFVSKAHG